MTDPTIAARSFSPHWEDGYGRVLLWRVATEPRRFRAEDLSGGGAAAAPGRWNKKGEPVLYAATSPALATLETAAHVDAAGLPLHKFLVQISLESEIWERRET